jgi:hypothetical protein
MPLFRRSDGDLLTDLSDVRRMMPYLMPGRNESIVYHAMQVKISTASAWIREYNRNRPRSEYATLFHLGLYVCAKLLHERPGVNRFVSGGRIYQRKGVWISFVAKKLLVDGAPFVTIKLPFPKNEPFKECVRRVTDAVLEGRSDRESLIDKEVRFLTRLPGPILRLIIAGGRWLDRLNLLPAAMIDPDPMFTSLFAANLGSISGSNAFHHLYEYGTCSLFAVMGEVRKTVLVDKDARPDVCDVLDVQWTFDERVNDGHYVLKTLAIGQQLLEHPEQWIGLPNAPKASGVRDTAEAADRTFSPQAKDLGTTPV